MFRKFKIAALAASMVVFANGVATAGNVPESSDPIKVIKNDWTGQLFSTEVVGGLLKEMGYNIEYVSAGALPQHPGIAQGNLIFKLRFGQTMWVIYTRILLIKAKLWLLVILASIQKRVGYIRHTWKKNVQACQITWRYMSVSKRLPQPQRFQMAGLLLILQTGGLAHVI
jgi:hypothetical protein